MHQPALKLLLGLFLLLAFAVRPVLAADAPAEKDWITGVTVAPGAMTWTSDNFANKKHVIEEAAGSLGKACRGDYAFLGWASGTGGTDAIVAKTKESYEKAGFTIERRPASIDTDILWLARGNAREAVILWSPVAGSTIYLSCLTAGAPPASADQSIDPLRLGLSLAALLAALLIAIWFLRHRRA